MTNEQIAKIIGEGPCEWEVHFCGGIFGRHKTFKLEIGAKAFKDAYETTGLLHKIIPVYSDYAHNTDAALRVWTWLQAQALENDEYFFLAFPLYEKYVIKVLLLQEHSAKIIEETTLRMAILTAFEWFCKERES